MKKVLLGLLAVSAVSMAADINPTNVYLKAGADVFTKTTVIKDDEGDAVNKKHNKKFKYELGVEATQVITPEIEVGLGVAYQDHGKLKSSDDWSILSLPKMRSYPVYAVAKYNIPVEGDYKPYIFANLGYSFNDGKSTFNDYVAEDDNEKIDMKYRNGMYWAVGTGVEINNFVIDLSYKMNHGKIKYAINGVEEDGAYSESGSKKVKYGRVTLGFGYKFSF